MLKRVKTQVEYKVPAWTYCNLVAKGSLGAPSKSMCRFCVKDGKSYRCALYNEPLLSEASTLVNKCNECNRTTAGYKSVVTDVEDNAGPTIDPKMLIKATLVEYDKLRKQLLSQGYPAALAEKAAAAHLLENK